ncbi:hypothetical protein BISA_0857 [Bifidobacterium saguini DSM 23967]|uniref:Uncharacterized protein n=2 Tax=Bifidobacterium saguini TaxID=762210 RepID=A0A087DAA7_9BIFI|nr:hypothetical protein [Bifidobacterium saguini]KFI92457.1 hypothetical protein BISA_0857 [Bifidobacterium saguini DSM 23967]QTB90818.1 hypothetical protein BSD967_11125 [Bifidobacterium saguini]QTB90880.1 hypothetical protein BSD967_11460 [Bifidobacterium saguini]
MNSLDEFIAQARAGHAPLTAADRESIANHRKYLERKAKDPDYWTRKRRKERKARKEQKS